MEAYDNKINNIKKDIESIRSELDSDTSYKTHQIGLAYRTECPSIGSKYGVTGVVIKALEIRIDDLLLEKEKEAQDKKLREMELEKARIDLQITMYANLSSKSEANIFDMSSVTLENAVETINNLSDAELNSVDKTELLKILEEMKVSNEIDRELTTIKALKFLGGKSKNVIKASIPYILKILYPTIF
ncbi:hypothetical protein [Methanimicrococcus blatticola]|uniref:Uncharacterized protein n=1 Tax=Methanimicrococcus blatticola TaxID=91560 RepID=A0A484F5N3_9EURY|nr:hypothetical protein [Methanimicrococcus blatticola]MBZ3935010.1 hypothetical protein [Methanimicrococcus blatticola]MCC2508892.1 hypothetical protein [Methanimicrococcus blatticola]TDQ71080.1 hypothetical protein C7391_0179 [Methanimicrococcus blatticola]